MFEPDENPNPVRKSGGSSSQIDRSMFEWFEIVDAVVGNV